MVDFSIAGHIYHTIQYAYLHIVQYLGPTMHVGILRGSLVCWNRFESEWTFSCYDFDNHICLQ